MSLLNRASRIEAAAKLEKIPKPAPQPEPEMAENVKDNKRKQGKQNKTGKQTASQQQQHTEKLTPEQQKLQAYIKQPDYHVPPLNVDGPITEQLRALFNNVWRGGSKRGAGEGGGGGKKGKNKERGGLSPSALFAAIGHRDETFKGFDQQGLLSLFSH